MPIDSLMHLIDAMNWPIVDLSLGTILYIISVLMFRYLEKKTGDCARKMRTIDNELAYDSEVRE